MSPCRIAAALLMKDPVANGETDTPIIAALGSDAISKPETLRQYKQLNSALNAETSGNTLCR